MRSLAGIRVIDLSRLLPGPACSWYLGGLGAEVVKIEDPAGGDYVRHVPPYDSRGLGLWFAALNGGKRSVALDLKRTSHRAALRALLAQADVLLEGFRPGVMARLGLDPAELVRSYPRLVVASLTGWGQTGPLADAPGHDLNYCGLAGALSLDARHEGVPDLPGLQVADLAGGALTAALAITAALYERERTGRGQWLDCAMLDGTLALVGHLVSAAAATGAGPAPGGETLTGAVASYGTYRAADGGLVALGALEPKFWAAFCAAVGADVPMEREAVAAVLARRARDEWASVGAGACLTPVLELHEVAAHPQIQARGLISGQGEQTRVRTPFPGAATPGPAPLLGEHTASALSAVGYDPSWLESP